MKIELTLVAASLKKYEVEPVIARKIIEDLQAELDEGDDGEKSPPVKKKYVLLLSDPTGNTPKDELVGWALQIPEEENTVLIADKINHAAFAYNATPKGQKYPVATVGNALEIVPSKVFKELGLWVKSRDPVSVVVTDNRLSLESSE